MEYSELVEIYSALGSTSKRLEKTRIIAFFIRKLSREEIPAGILLLQGKVFPEWSESKLGVASKLVARAISKATGKSLAEIESDWKTTGDLGSTAQNMVRKKRQSTLFSESLSVKKVFATMIKIAGLEGCGSEEQKMQLIAELLTSATPEEARYIVRTLLLDLRIGIGEGAMRDALVWAFFGDSLGLTLQGEEIEIKDREGYNKHADAVQQAYDTSNDFAIVAELCKTKGYSGLLSQDLQPGKPVKVMLSLKVNDAKEGLLRVGQPLEAEYKLDGFRLQLHKKGKEFRLFTRRLEDVTRQFPDVINYLHAVDADSFILDAEAVGYDAKTMKYLPFQSISQRIRRKHQIDEVASRFPVEVNIFDILYLNGESMLHEPFKDRRTILEKIVRQKQRQIVLVRKIVTDSEAKIKEFFAEALDAGTEGLMLKNLDSPYKPGARVGYMVKLKQTMENLDLSIIGAEWGEGKRASWLSSFTLACRDEESNLYEIGKVSTGLKEKDEEGLSFNQMTQLLRPLILSEKGREVTLKPEVVIEVAYEEIQKSPTYSSGFALRFPRVVRLRTEEKGKEDISSLEYIEEMYYSQGEK